MNNFDDCIEDEVVVNSETIERTRRNSELCEYCRKDKKKCEEHLTDTLKRCRLCVEKNRPCSRRRRAQRSADDGTTFTATIIAMLTLLHLCLDQCNQTLSVICPFPFANPMDNGAAFRSQSWTLSDALKPIIGALRLNDCVLRGLRVVVSQSWYRVCAGEIPILLEAASADDASILRSCFNNFDNSWRGFAQKTALQTSPLHQRMWRYLDAEQKLLKLLQALDLSSALSPDLCQLLHGTGLDLTRAFPACHIAFWNGDWDIAFELWKARRWATDMMGRGFPHIVAEVGNLHMLKRINSYCNTSLVGSWSDVRGFSVLETCVFARAADCVEYLLGINPITSFGTTIYPLLLDLALAAGNSHIVAGLAGMNVAVPEVTMLMVKVIELGRADLAQHFLCYLGDGQIASQGEVDRLAYLAAQMSEVLRTYAELAQHSGWTNRWMELRARYQSMVQLHEYLRRVKINKPAAAAATRSLNILDYPEEGISFDGNPTY